MLPVYWILPVRCVRFRHQLLNLGPHFALVQEGVAATVKRGWYALFEWFPFFPMVLFPKGAVERKLEAKRPRPTCDASNPHAASGILDSEGEPVVSLNDRIKATVRVRGVRPEEPLVAEPTLPQRL